ncbi:hypothetical protein AGMMS49942_07590 [Spirochaetia bacterium]|nr:hypothetical protein AGMMS49942_07590 [Spirochaetia bacterium]
MNEIPQRIETRTPRILPPEQELKKKLNGMLGQFNMDYLHEVRRCLFGLSEAPRRLKAALVSEVANALCFTDIEKFNAWFYALPSLTQGILWYACFEEYVPAKIIEERYGVSLIYKEQDIPWRRDEWHFKKETLLDFLFVSQCYEYPIISLPRYLKAAFKHWFVPLPETFLENCLCNEDGAQKEPVYNNSIAIVESFPLLCDALRQTLEGMDGPEKEKARVGFKKGTITDLQNASGFLPFPIGGDHAPNSVDIAARFIMLMNNSKVSRPENPYTAMRELIRHFFSTESRLPQKYHSTDRNVLDASLLLDHLAKTMYRLDEYSSLPYSRTVLKEILHLLADDGRSFDAGKLADYLTYNWDSFSFSGEGFETQCNLKVDILKLGGMVYESKNYGGFYTFKNFRKDFIVKPAFKAYCYLFASLGILAITQKEPALVRTVKDKEYPLSPYDSLDSVRVTDFGRWCLGITDMLPGLPEQKYEAIADKTLFLVTIRGKSLERRVYLDRIGRKLGEDRWRISAGSFIAGCANKNEIEERIVSFRRLIDGNPGPHWKALFQKVCARAGLFDEQRNDVRVYSLPEDKELRTELLADPALKTVALRCEGNMLVVPVKKMKQFTAFLEEHGIAGFSLS